jgi:3-oxoacyl-(acyl-carrier-protein) synthase
MTCLGNGVSVLWRGAEDGHSGLNEGLGLVPETAFASGRAAMRANPLFCNIEVPNSRSKELSLIALEQALTSAGWTTLDERDGLILATTTGQIPVWDKALAAYLQKTISKDDFVEAFDHQPLGDLLASLSQLIGFKGRQLLVASACSASTQALAMAAMWLEQGLVRRCVVGGVEVLCDLTVNGFSSLQLLSRHATKPFDAYRNGINLSEGAGFLCLEGEESARALAKLSGFGMSSDGYHMTAPHPEGKGCYQAMRKALEVAQLTPHEVDWIHAHGTGSSHNDIAESAAIRALFQDEMPWVSSSKWVHGHALGASGAIESILCIEALQRQIILKTHGLEQPDHTLVLRHPSEHLRTRVHHILKNTLGFGGTNAALVWSAVGGA